MDGLFYLNVTRATTCACETRNRFRYTTGILQNVNNGSQLTLVGSDPQLGVTGQEHHQQQNIGRRCRVSASGRHRFRVFLCCRFTI